MARKKPTAPPLPLAKRLAFGAILTLSPLLLFFILEFSLMVLGLGYDPAPLIRPPRLPNYYVTNPDYLRRFQTSDGQRELSGSVLIPVKKAPGTYRIFVLGESTPQGFPFFKNQAFGPAAGRILEEAWGTPVEVINLGATATTSFYVADLAPRLLEYDPDLLVIYSGHNEYYGYQSIADGSSPELQRLGLWLRQFRIFQVLSEGLRPPPPPSENMMQRQFAGREFPLDDERDNRVTQTFIYNIISAIQSWQKTSLPVILMEPVSNVLDFGPFLQNTHEGIGRDLESDLSNPLLERAVLIKDADLMPFRARSNLVQAFRNIFQENNSLENLNYFETSTFFQNRSQRAFSFQFFLEHVHFNTEGHLALAEDLSAFINNITKQKEWTYDESKNRNALLSTFLTEAKAMKTIENLSLQFPFTQQLNGFSPPIETWLENNFFFADKNFWNQLVPDQYYQQGIDYLKNNNNHPMILNELINNIHLFPGSPVVYSELSKVLLQDGQTRKAEELNTFSSSLKLY